MKCDTNSDLEKKCSQVSNIWETLFKVIFSNGVLRTRGTLYESTFGVWLIDADVSWLRPLQ